MDPANTELVKYLVQCLAFSYMYESICIRDIMTWTQIIAYSYSLMLDIKKDRIVILCQFYLSDCCFFTGFSVDTSQKHRMALKVTTNHRWYALNHSHSNVDCIMK